MRTRAAREGLVSAQSTHWSEPQYKRKYPEDWREIMSSIGRVGRAAQQGEKPLAAARAGHEELIGWVRAKMH